ncbi:hypothetical protein AB0E64_21520 [Streptomyces caelestis]|uniref:Lipoprotein n=1 Tax=Streptomyces caelestis TaxID=36816 RepID=A0A7W9H3Q5_9ACTN|nr:hypothetical protein [Streptomyces caelestis]MBB5794843.1 hypothetical protein [Streptomyces caelestis]GGW27824.1 hypothetical protein GCM10010320_03230 [Streptomyces caelestis]
MRFGTKAALLGAAISALTVSGAGSAYADDDQPAHTYEAHSEKDHSGKDHSGKDHSGKGHSGKGHSGKGHSSHDEDRVVFAKSDKVTYSGSYEESAPAPIAAVPAGPLCDQSIAATGGDAEAGGDATGGAATASGNTQTLTCTITINSPLGSGDQTVTRTSRVFFTEEDQTLIVKD